MKQPAAPTSGHLLRGTFQILATDALLIPTGILTAAYLSRRFGANGYGLLVAGTAPDLILFIFGSEFLPAAPLLRLLIFAALALLMIAVTTSIMTAAGKTGWTLHVAWPLLVGAVAGHFLLIPLAGAMGAALMTTLIAIIGAVVSIGLVRRLWQIALPVGTLWRAFPVSAVIYVAVAELPATGLMLALKLAGAGVFVVAALLLAGEFSAEEIGVLRARIRRRPQDPLVEASGSTT